MISIIVSLAFFYQSPGQLAHADVGDLPPRVTSPSNTCTTSTATATKALPVRR